MRHAMPRKLTTEVLSTEHVSEPAEAWSLRGSMLPAQAIAASLAFFLCGCCAASRSARTATSTFPPLSETKGMVTVVCETKYYVSGFGPDPPQLLKRADTNLLWEVNGIVLEVVRPLEY